MEVEGHYHAHKSPSLLSILSQVKAVALSCLKYLDQF
jgi:hypothetical protein